MDFMSELEVLIEDLRDIRSEYEADLAVLIRERQKLLREHFHRKEQEEVDLMKSRLSGTV